MVSLALSRFGCDGWARELERACWPCTSLRPGPGSGSTSSLAVFVFTSQYRSREPETTKAECNKGGYKDFGFKKQGQCIKAVKSAS
jgi:hypothetical protein